MMMTYPPYTGANTSEDTNKGESSETSEDTNTEENTLARGRPYPPEARQYRTASKKGRRNWNVTLMVIDLPMQHDGHHFVR